MQNYFPIQSSLLSVPSLSSLFRVHSAVRQFLSGGWCFVCGVIFGISHSSPIKFYPEFYLSSCTDSFRGLMCCFGRATCGSGSCGVKGKSSCFMYKLLPWEASLFPINIAEDKPKGSGPLFCVISLGPTLPGLRLISLSIFCYKQTRPSSKLRSPSLEAGRLPSLQVTWPGHW